ncbi:M3 peptidase [Helicosporidium sp. ATCC 50920]|nr:M3 peptidase [Helicosporidium sp. ATCC 50920]|eukprot:KDD76688.1 M3 peptidase [Helicosporidium sp. ATCC 50920]
MQRDHEPIPFDKMHPSMLVSAACVLVQHLHTGLDQLESETTATWGRVVEPLELLYDSYERVTGVFEFMAMMDLSEQMEAALDQGQALTSGFSRRLHQSTALYTSLLHIRNHEDAWLHHSFSQLRALDHWIAKMDLRGVHLARNSTQVDTFVRLDAEEAKLQRLFIKNIACGTKLFHLTVRNGEHLRGVPPSILAAMAAEAQKRDLTYAPDAPGVTHPASTEPPIGSPPTMEWGPWTVTFDHAVYNGMMAYCPSRRLRQVIFQSFENRASMVPCNNVPVVEGLLQVRREKAHLLGSSSYADLTGRMGMASSNQSNRILDDLLNPVASAAARSVLPMLRLMVDSEAVEEDVWGEQLESGDLRTIIASGAHLAIAWYSMVTPSIKPKPVFVPTVVKSFMSARTNRRPSINREALEWAENALSNGTLSQPACRALLANVTSHFMLWDVPYWARRLDASKDFSKQRAGAALDHIINYFPLSRVLSGAFGLLNRLWGMHVVESVHDKPPVWHPDVRHFRLFNGTKLLGSFFFDPFSRPDKLSIPFSRDLMKRSEAHGSWPTMVRAPVAAMSTCFTPPEPGEPALLTISNILELFHQLGHVIQSLINQENQVLIAGTTTLPLDLSEVGATEKGVLA